MTIDLENRDTLEYAVIHYFSVDRYCGRPHRESPAVTWIQNALGVTEERFWELTTELMERER